MTEKNPPPGKVWLTVEIDQDDYDQTADVDLWDLEEVAVSRGEDPSDKCNRLLNEAESKFRDAYHSYPISTPQVTGEYLSQGARLLAEALKVFREEL